jgi:glycosyltransferase involved in cell wall biosynthesis
MKCLVAGTCRDIEKYWNNTQKCLSTIFDSLDDYKCVIVESNSSDNTLNLLKEWERQDSRRTVISLGMLNEHSRTKRIAQGRNEYLKYTTDFEYMLVIDLDDILDIEHSFRQQLASCFQRTDWDAIASNRKGEYYDIWALRSREMGIDFDCLHMASRKTAVLLGSRGFQKPYDYYVTRFQKHIPRNSNWIECQSAFGGMALYKTASIKNNYNGDQTCEHVSFHRGMKIFINPQFISG